MDHMATKPSPPAVRMSLRNWARKLHLSPLLLAEHLIATGARSSDQRASMVPSAPQIQRALWHYADAHHTWPRFATHLRDLASTEHLLTLIADRLPELSTPDKPAAS